MNDNFIQLHIVIPPVLVGGAGTQGGFCGTNTGDYNF